MNNFKSSLISLQLAGHAEFANSINIHSELWAQNPSAFLFGLPHSGRAYLPNFIKSTRLNLLDLRSSEDAFVDQLFADVAKLGGNRLCAHFPRAYVDANRYETELDPELFIEPPYNHPYTSSPLVAAGIGVIPRVVGGQKNIYHGRISLQQAKARLEAHYLPYHFILNGLIKSAQQQYGYSLLVDCHSMPALHSLNHLAPDIILGNLHGRSCHDEISELIFNYFVDCGLRVKYNQPYAGGAITQKYHDTSNGYHSLQIEINRSLYMNEETLEKNNRFKYLQAVMNDLTHKITQMDAAFLRPTQRHAAE